MVVAAIAEALRRTERGRYPRSEGRGREPSRFRLTDKKRPDCFQSGPWSDHAARERYFEMRRREIEIAISLNAFSSSAVLLARKACCGLVAHASRKSSLYCAVLISRPTV